jgi:hypothetical protein
MYRHTQRGLFPARRCRALRGRMLAPRGRPECALPKRLPSAASDIRLSSDPPGIWQELLGRRGNQTAHMGVHNRRSYLRPTALLVVLLIHCGLILVLLRAKPLYGDRHLSPQTYMTIFFISPQPRLTPALSETFLTPHRKGKTIERQFLSDTPPMPNTGLTSPIKNQESTATPTIDWFAEGEKSVAEIANRGQPGRAAESPPPPIGSAPWDPHPHLFETTGHGFKVNIPVRIPGNIIDHCFGNFDLGQDQGGKWEKYKLECALKKQPARGDLFDSLRQPSEPLK